MILNHQLQYLVKRKAAIALCAFFVLASFACAPTSLVPISFMERIAAKRMELNIINRLEDGLHLVLCGSGSPLPDPDRSGPCVMIIAGDTMVVVDAGSGGSGNLGAMQIPLGKMKALFLTHYHSDHIDGLGSMAMMRWVSNANKEPLKVIGPVGAKKVVEGFNIAYEIDSGYRFAHHGDTVAPLSGKGMVAEEFDMPEEGELPVVFEMNGLTVTTFKVDHAPIEPAVGYRFDYKGRSIVISGDTVKSANLESMSQGVDLLVHEALSIKLVNIMNSAAKANGNAVLDKITYDIVDYHTTPVEAAEIAESAQVGHLLYYHIVPPLVVPGIKSVFLEGVGKAYKGDVTIGDDGTFISLPANKKTIKVQNLL